MSQKHFKSTPFYKQSSLNVDREAGVINNISIVEVGANKNGTYFGEKYLIDLAKGANEQNQGVKSRFGHPNMCSTSLGTFIGRYKDFKVENNQVKANLHLDPISKKTQVEGKGISMFEYVMDMAENNPDVFGNSIHIPVPKYEKEAFEVDGVKYQSHIYNGIIASDIVDEPAATSGLFDESDDLGVITTQFLDENPSIFSVIQKDPSILKDFFERYFNYLNLNKSNIDMSFLNKLKKKFGKDEKFDIDLTLADGQIVTVVTEAETPQVGDTIKKEDGSQLTDGDHTDKDGGTIVVEGGVIKELKKPEPNDPPSADDEPTMGEVMQSVNNLKEMFQTFSKKQITQKQFSEMASDIELLANSITEIEEKHNTLAGSIESSFDIDDEGLVTSLKSTKGEKTSLDSLKERKEQLKKR